MRFPSKIVSYEQSCLSKMPVLLQKLQQHSYTPAALFQSAKNIFEDISEFIDTLVLLFALKKITVNKDGEITYVEKP